MSANVSVFGWRAEIVCGKNRAAASAEEIVPEIILHQYVTSPFSEKIRKIFAHKKISWRSVEQPVIMPKPKLVPLTGGYRRVPVLQNHARSCSRTPTLITQSHQLH